MVEVMNFSFGPTALHMVRGLCTQAQVNTIRTARAAASSCTQHMQHLPPQCPSNVPHRPQCSRTRLERIWTHNNRLIPITRNHLQMPIPVFYLPRLPLPSPRFLLVPQHPSNVPHHAQSDRTRPDQIWRHTDHQLQFLSKVLKSPIPVFHVPRLPQSLPSLLLLSPRPPHVAQPLRTMRTTTSFV